MFIFRGTSTTSIITTHERSYNFKQGDASYNRDDLQGILELHRVSDDVIGLSYIVQSKVRLRNF